MSSTLLEALEGVVFKGLAFNYVKVQPIENALDYHTLHLCLYTLYCCGAKCLYVVSVQSFRAGAALTWPLVYRVLSHK